MIATETLQRLLGINPSLQISSESPNEPHRYSVPSRPLSEDLAKKAYESILNFDENDGYDPRGNAESAFNASENVQQGSPSASFGQSQRESRLQEESRQRKVLHQAADKSTLSGEYLANEGEHLVHRDEISGIAHKSTNSLRYGLVLDQDEWKPHRKLAARPALPSEYLWRIGLQNAAFGDNIKLTGVALSDGEPTIQTSQPWIKGTAPSLEEVGSFMEAQGFERISNGMMAAGYPSALAWYRTEDQVLVYDAKESNFVKKDTGVILPIDLVVQIYPLQLLRETAQINEVQWPTIGA
ncbi:hypothetical protein BH11VER1_BH11VER1_03520 [soil metagenome]